MANIALVKPEWLEIINCCSPKVQMDLIRAIVAWQTDGTMPDFRGTKKALFLMLVHDLVGEASVQESVDAGTAEDDGDAPEEKATTTPTSAEGMRPEESIPNSPQRPVRNATKRRVDSHRLSPAYPYALLY